jgi:hypothetical protein
LAYTPKIWVDRVTEYPNRRMLTNTGITDVKEVTRAEGTITAEGDKINATNLNGFDTRVSAAFKAMGVDTYTCTKTGTIFDLVNSNSPENGKFLAPAAYVAGDVFRVNPTAQKFNKDLAVAGYIDSTDGAVKTSAVSNYSSALIIISPFTAYKIVGHTYTQPAATVGIAWYNSSGTYISGTSYGSATGNGTYTSPSTAYYARYTINTANLSVSIFELNSSANTSAVYTAAYTVQTSSGVALANGAFVNGAIVPITLDITNYKIYIAASDAKTVNGISLSDKQLITQVTCTKSGTVFALTGVPTTYTDGYQRLIGFFTSWDFNIGDTFTINGVASVNTLMVDATASGLYDKAFRAYMFVVMALRGGPSLNMLSASHVNSADYAGTIAATTAALRNNLILEHRTDSVPTGLAANTIVWWKDQT